MSVNWEGRKRIMKQRMVAGINCGEEGTSDLTVFGEKPRMLANHYITKDLQDDNEWRETWGQGQS